MQILFLILKIIGLVILGLLALVIFLLLLILFWPIRYRALVSYHSEPFADVRAGWAGIAAFKLKLEKGELLYRLKFLGITLKEKGGSSENKKAGKHVKGIRSKKNDKEGKENKRRKKKYGDENNGESENIENTDETIVTKRKDAVREESEVREIKSESIEESKEEKESKEDEGSKIKDKELSRKKIPKTAQVAAGIKKAVIKIKSVLTLTAIKIAGIVGKIKNILNNIKEKIRNIRNKFLSLCHKIKKVYGFITLQDNRDCAKALLKIGTRLLKHMRPRKIKGFLRFGTDDPCRTGQILGVLAVFYGFYGKNISIYPEFEKSCLDGELFFKGYMQIGVILFHALKIYLSKELKTLKYNYQQLKEEL